MENNLLELDNSEQNKKIMEGWLIFLKNLSNKKQDDIEMILANILDLLKDLSSRGVFGNEEIQDDSQKFFFSTFIVDLIKYILQDNSKNPITKELLKEILDFFLQEFISNHNNPKLKPMIEAVSNIFNEDFPFYRSIDGKDASDIFLEKTYDIINPQQYLWRNTLVEGSMIDYLYRDSIFNNNSYISKSIGVASWTRAQIISMSENKNLIIKLLGNSSIISNVNIFSPFILPFKTCSEDFEWREALQIGDEIDYLDNKSWCRSTVLDVTHKLQSDSDCIKKYITYGLRIYRDEGRCVDSKNAKNFFGWPSQFDKETSVHDPKIRKPNEFSKVIENYHLITSYPIDSKKFNENDSFIPFDIHGRKFYIIPRKSETKNIDYLFFDLTNLFCEQYNGLNKILDFLRDSRIDYDLFYNLVDIVYNLHLFMHIKFCQIFIKEFVSHCIQILKKFSVQEVRNFKRDKFESIIKKLKEIFFKIAIDVDVNVVFDLFSIEFSLNCFKSSTILDKRLLGLKILTDTLLEATKSSNSSLNSDKHLSSPILMSKIFLIDKEGNNIFDLIYGSQSHSQIIQKSTELLKTFFMGRVLTTKDIRQLLTIAKETSDHETRDVIYKALQQNNSQMGLELQIFLIKRIIETPSDKLTQVDLDLLISTFKAIPSYGNKEIAKCLINYLFELIFNTGISVKLYGNIVDEWVNMLKIREFNDLIFSYERRLIDLIQNSNMDLIKVLKILRKLLQNLLNVIDDSKKELLIVTLFEGNSNEQSDDQLRNDFNIIDLVINFFSEYHNEVNVDKRSTITMYNDIDNHIFKLIKRTNYSSHSEIVNEIITFFSLFNNLKNFTFSNEQINKLYNICVQNYISVKDSNLFFKWLKEAQDKKVIPNGILEEIFALMIKNNDLEFSNISGDLFSCLWNIFITINKNAGLLYFNENICESSEAYSGISNSGQTLLSYSYNSSKNETEVKCLISNPTDLIGFNLIWGLVISSTGEVSKKAIANTLMLFLNSNTNRGEIWYILIEKCMNTIKFMVNQDSPMNLNDKDDSGSTGKRLKINSCLTVLKNLIEETEKKGTAGCVSHSSILKNSLLNIKIVNSISFKNGCSTYSKSDNISTKCEKQFNLKVYSNTTIWDMKILIGKKIGVIPECIKFSLTGSKEILENEHGKTLSELRINNNDTLTVSKSNILENIPKVTLICNGKLSDKAYKAFSEIFEQLSTDGLMNKEQCAEFATIAVDTNEKISADDFRIKCVFDQHDEDRDGFLDLEGFCGFFVHAIVVQKKPNTVWDNLKAFNYRNDLKKLNEPLDEYNTDIKIMPRYVLSKNQEFFNLIFELQDQEEQIAKEASKFLSMICTNPIIYRDILNERKFSDWSTYLDVKNHFKLLYSLQIVESLFEEFEIDGHTDNDDVFVIEPEDKELLIELTLDNTISWIENFITKGGINHIIDNILLVSVDMNNRHSKQFKKCLNLSLKTVRVCSTILFRALNSKNKKDDAIMLIRKESFNDNINIADDAFAVHIPNKKKKSEMETNLIQMINHMYGDTVIKTINFKLLSQNLINIAHEIVIKGNSDLEERSLIINALSFLSLIIISQDDINNFLNNSIYNYNFSLNDEFIDFDKFLMTGLFSSNIYFKFNYQKSFKNLAMNLNNIKEHSFTLKLIEISNKKIYNLTQNEKNNSRYFFDLYQSLIQIGITLNNNIDYDNLVFNIIEILKSDANIIEEELLNGYLKILNTVISNRDANFKYLIGVELKLINIITESYLIKDLKFNPNELFQDYNSLIDPTDKKYNKYLNIPNYSTMESRQCIFNLLFTLISDTVINLSEFFENVKVTQLLQYTSKIKNEKKFYNPSMEKRGTSGYVGIKNLRCICYMISVMQQFFNIPSFRYALMKLDNGNDNNEKLPLDNPLLQLQKMFVQLELTQRSEVNPSDFCYAFKGIDGLPTNINQQQDAQEFLGRLFDILENRLKETEYKYLLQSVFLGQTCSQLICKGGCGKISNNFEDFYNISLEVQNKSSLRESLDKYISEDKIDDFYCENCRKKVSVVKRTSFAELPNILIVHLQRIQFNYESLVNEKINSRLEFPKQINLKEYCIESIESDNAHTHDKIYTKEDSYYEYQLVGVVVHLGVADAGHYYSNINVKRDGTYETMEKDMHGKNWLTFNDSSVTNFNLNQLEYDCFGGSSSTSTAVHGSGLFGGGINVGNIPDVPSSAFKNDDISSFWGPTNKSDNNKDNSKNAYMLVYERIKKSPLKITIKNDIDDLLANKKIISYNDENYSKIQREFSIFSNLYRNENVSLDCENTTISRRDIYNNIFYHENSKEYHYFIPFYSVNKLIPATYFYEVVNDNISFINDQKIYSNTFSEFLANITENILKVMKNSFFPVKKIFTTLLTYLTEILISSNSRDNLNSIINNMNGIVKHDPELSNIVLDYMNSNLQKNISELIFSSEENANMAFKNLLVNTIVENFKLNPMEIMTNPDKSLAIKLLDYLLGMIPFELSKNWTKFSAFLGMLEDLVKSNDELILEYLFSQETIYKLVDFMLGKESPFYKADKDHRTEMGNKFVIPKFHSLVGTVSWLVRHCYTDYWKESDFTNGKVPHTLVKCNHRIFQMSERERIIITDKTFIKKAIKESHNLLGLSRILAHVMYDNYKFSKKKLFLIMEAFNNVIPASEAKNAFDLIYHPLLIEDKFTNQRLEWVFGIPQMVIKISDSNSKVCGYPSLIPRGSKWGDRILRYFSPLSYGTDYESLTERIIGKYQSSADFISILNFFFATVFSKKHIFNYISSLPHPKCDAKLLKDYLFYLAEEEKNRIVGLNVGSLLSKYEKDIKGINTVFQDWENKRQDFNRCSDEETKFLAKYKYGNIIREHHTNFINEKLNSENIYIISVDYDVEIESEELNLQTGGTNFINTDFNIISGN